MNELISSDPLTASWLLAILLIFAIVVVVPIIRFLLSGAVYAVAAITGKQHLRVVARRLMPRIGHLLGAVIVGISSTAAPAFAAPRAEDTAISIDRDGAWLAPATARVEATATSESSTADAPTTNTQPTTTIPADDMRITPTTTTTAALYVVRGGDSLWSIAESSLQNPTDAQITETWKAIWKANRQVIGDHPERITPGMSLKGVIA